MPTNHHQELAARISKASGIEATVVSKVLSGLASLAYANCKAGFVLPGFGKFQVILGAETVGKNPFTGKPTVFRAPPDVEFTIDTEAKQAFISGKAEFTETSAAPNVRSSLNEIRLTPNPDDLKSLDGDIKKSPLCKIGGEPDWLQYPSVPVCCGEDMTFYGQLDSLNNREYCVGDMGKLYVFFCQQCCKSHSIMQF
jgi:nucleoid DNA-binding protein